MATIHDGFFLKVLGGFNLTDSTGSPIELKARKNRQLLAILALQGGRHHSRDQLAAMLWPDRQEEQARGSLRTALSGLRNALGDDALIVEQDAVAIRRGIITTDYEQLKQGHLLDTDALQTTGEFLSGLDGDGEALADWLATMRTQCNEILIEAFDTAADQMMHAKDQNGAIRLLRNSLSLEPLREDTHRRIMQAYADVGERGMALAQFRACREILQSELGVEPAPETKALADRIALKSEEAADRLRQQSHDLDIALGNVSLDRVATNPKETGIAVLPFVNMSGDAEQAYFADGITEDILTDLSSVEGLSVAAKNSSQLFRGAMANAAQISQDLGVRFLLEGSVRMAGQAVRIAAQLTDAQANRQIWAQRYDRTMENIFELQEEISKEIVGALRLNLAPEAERPSDSRMTSNPAAYDLYLRARTRMRGFNRKDLERAHTLFWECVKLDPDFSLAHAGVAISVSLFYLHYGADDAMKVRAVESCAHAVKTAPDLPETYAARGMVQLLDGTTDQARKFLQTAVDLRPDWGYANSLLGFAEISEGGSMERAAEAFERAFALDRDIMDGLMLASVLGGLGRNDEIEQYSDQILKVAQKRLTADQYDFAATMGIAKVYTDRGEVEEATRWNEIAAEFDERDSRTLYNLSCNYALLGQKDRSLELLRKALETGTAWQKIEYIASRDPDMNNLRGDPRFKELIAEFRPG